MFGNWRRRHVRALGGQLQDIAERSGDIDDVVGHAMTFTQTPPDLAGCLALAVLSTACAGKATVTVRTPDSGERLRAEVIS